MNQNKFVKVFDTLRPILGTAEATRLAVQVATREEKESKESAPAAPTKRPIGRPPSPNSAATRIVEFANRANGATWTLGDCVKFLGGNTHRNYVNNLLSRLISKGKIKRVGVGEYRAV